jgi:hypothetical protein
MPVTPLVVHVPQTGDEKLSSGVDHLGVLGDAGPFCNFRNTVAADHYRHVGERGRASRINHSDMGEGQDSRFGGRTLLGRRESEQQGEK